MNLRIPAFFERSIGIPVLSVSGVFCLILLGASFSAVVFLGYTTAHRIAYPFDLEWLEGWIMMHGVRVMLDKPLYCPPSLEFIPSNYPPLYMVIIGSLMKITGAEYWIARSVSIVSSIAAWLILLKILFKETRSLFWSLASSSLFPACYGIALLWYDLARVDMLYLFLTVLTFYLIRHHGKTKTGLILSALTYTAAVMTKQPALAFLPFLFFLLWISNKRNALVFMGSAVLFISAAFTYYHVKSDGWFFHYLFLVPAHRKTLWDVFFIKSPRELTGFFPIAVSISLVWSLQRFFYCPRGFLKPDSNNFWIIAAVPAAMTSILLRANTGGWAYNYIPAYWFASLLTGLAGWNVFQFFLKNNKKAAEKTVAAAAAVLIFQYIILFYPPDHVIPVLKDIRTGENFLEQIAALPGPALIPHHPFYTYKAQRFQHYHQMGLIDILKNDEQDFPQDILESIRQKKFTAIIFDGENKPEYPELNLHYYFAGENPSSNPKLRVFSGLRVYPRFLYLSKQGHSWRKRLKGWKALRILGNQNLSPDEQDELH